MSLLAPLYVLGALGIGLPILFHLIRRQPRGQRRFSSLMFLRPTPPTLTRRSRLDNVLLLMIRAAALILLATAFAKPFLRSPLLDTDDAVGERIVMLVDVSASMRRSDLWKQAIQSASDVLNRLRPADQIAIVSFSIASRIEFSLEQSSALDASSRRDSAAQSLKALRPTWEASYLGNAIIFGAELLSATEVIDSSHRDSTTNGSGRIIVISDMQAGSEQNLQGLQAYRWPKSIKVELRTVVPEQPTNAVAVVLPPGVDLEDAVSDSTSPETTSDPKHQRTRVRVSNSEDAKITDFVIAWADVTGKKIESTSMPVHVGPGENRVVRMVDPPSSESSERLTLALSGDDHNFDNTKYVTRPKPLDKTLLFVGPVSTVSRASLLYYLQRTPFSNRDCNVSLQTVLPSAIPDVVDVKLMPLIVVAGSINEASTQSLKRYVSNGGRLLWVLDKNAELNVAQTSLRLLADNADLSITEGQVRDYAMWSKIDFAHPLFKPLADSRYNDFTKIRFWSHRKLAGLSDRWKRVADFDDGDPSIAELLLGEGRIWVLTVGWQPSESQLALSTKFVPLVYGFFGVGEHAESQFSHLSIGDESPFVPSPTASIESPGKAPIPYRVKEDYAQVDEPGFYRFVDREIDRSVAVNVAESESRTRVLATDELERCGVLIGVASDVDATVARQRQQRDIELEGRQKIWQWVFVAVLGLLGLETCLSGYLDRKQIQQSA